MIESSRNLRRTGPIRGVGVRCLRPVVGAIAALAMAGVASATAMAASPSVGVQVRFASDAVTSPWGGPSVKTDTESASGTAVVDVLKPYFSYWTFTPNVQPNEDYLQFEVMPGLNNKIIIRVEAFSHGVRSQKWDTDWLDLVDVIGRAKLANSRTVPALLAQAVDTGVLGQHEDAIREWLRTEVPVASGGQWFTPPTQPYAVLALPYATFGLVGASTFEVLAVPPSGPPERLSVVGLSFKAPYSPAGGAGSNFDGLVVAAQSRLIAGQEQSINDAAVPSVRQLTLRQVYLKERRNSNDPDVLVSPEDSR